MFKRFIASFIAAAMFVSLVPQFSLTASAAAPAVAPDGYVIIRAADWGIVQNTAHDDEAAAQANTKAIQTAIDTLYAQGYRKMRLETMDVTVWGVNRDGNPYSNREYGICMRTGMSFDMNGSTFRLASNEWYRTTIILIGVEATDYYWDGSNSRRRPVEYTTDVEIFNGTLIGDRYTHDYWQPIGPEDHGPDKGGFLSGHEWGYGIHIRGNAERVKVHNMLITDIMGNCIATDGKDVEIYDNILRMARQNAIVTGSDGVKIYGNYMHDFYNDVVIPGLIYNSSGLTAEQRDMGISYGIGAQSCITVENSNGAMNFEIYDNHFDNKNSPLTHGGVFLWHMGTIGMYIHDNIIRGNITTIHGSNMIYENNKMFDGGYSISGGASTYNGDYYAPSDPLYRKGLTDIRNHIFINNYCYNYGLYLRADFNTPNALAQEGGMNWAFIGNHFINGGYQTLRSTPTAFVSNVWNTEGRIIGGGTVYLNYADDALKKLSPEYQKMIADRPFINAFVGELRQTIEDGTWNSQSPGYRELRTFGGITSNAQTGTGFITRNGYILPQELADAHGYSWYKETDDTAKVTAFLQNFKSLGPYNLHVWDNWYNNFKTDENLNYWYHKNDAIKNEPMYTGGKYNGFTPPYTYEEEVAKWNAQHSPGPITGAAPAQRPAVSNVTVSPSVVLAAPGGEYQFTANVASTDGFPKTVTWEVIGANAGNYIGGTYITKEGLLSIAPGETAKTLTVRATSAFDGFVYGEAIVSLGDFIPVTDIIASVPSEIEAGQSVTLSATVLPADASSRNVSWRVRASGTTATARISNNELTATTPGMLIIQAVAPSGSAPGRDFTKDFTITVKEAEVTPVSYSIKWNVSGGIFKDTAPYTYIYGVGLSSFPAAERAGYAFDGWYNNADLAGNPITSISETASGDKEFWAKWNDITAPVGTITIGSQSWGSFGGVSSFDLFMKGTQTAYIEAVDNDSANVTAQYYISSEIYATTAELEQAALWVAYNPAGISLTRGK